MSRLAFRAYLSPEHRDTSGTGCPIAALASEVARHPRPTRNTFASHSAPTLDALATWLSSRKGKRVDRADAAAFMGLLAGTLQLARTKRRDPGKAEVPWWRRRESKPEGERRETTRDVPKRREREGAAAVVGDDSRRPIAKAPTARAALIASLAEHVRALALAGDIEAARVASEAIGRLLGSNETAGSVVDLGGARARRGD